MYQIQQLGHPNLEATTFYLYLDSKFCRSRALQSSYAQQLLATLGGNKKKKKFADKHFTYSEKVWFGLGKKPSWFIQRDCLVKIRKRFHFFSKVSHITSLTQHNFC